MDIEVGEYVRTEFDGIGKVIDIKEHPLRYVYNEYGNIALDSEIVKHSKNIIDLIEEGDYVNGKEIKMNYETGKLRNIPSQIKTILTHEQYEINCYRLEE